MQRTKWNGFVSEVESELKGHAQGPFLGVDCVGPRMLPHSMPRNCRAEGRHLTESHLCVQ